MTHNRLVFLAAGGTGGHIFPAYSLGVMLLKKGYRASLLTDTRGLRYRPMFEAAGLGVHPISAASPGVGNVIHRAIGGLKLARGTVQAWHLMARQRPIAVAGFGGYAAFPPMIAALIRRLPTLIHEQNAYLGRVNRVLAPKVDRVLTSFEKTRAIPEGIAPLCPGMPVRADIAALAEQPYPAPQAGGPFRVLVLGGSQGAALFSRLIPDALALLEGDLRARLDLTLQCREEDIPAARAILEQAGITATIAPFFDDVPARLATTHLVVSRAGASTVAELIAAGRPSVLIPFAAAADDHQTCNAQALADAGGAWLMPEPVLTARALADRIASLMARPDLCTLAARATRSLIRPDAAAAMADMLIDLIDGTGRFAPTAHSSTTKTQEAL